MKETGFTLFRPHVLPASLPSQLPSTRRGSGKGKSDVFVHDHSCIELLSLEPRRVPRAEMVAFGFAFFSLFVSEEQSVFGMFKKC